LPHYLYSPNCLEDVSLLKKSLLDRLVLPNQVQNARKTMLLAPEQGSEKGHEGVFQLAHVFSENPLGPGSVALEDRVEGVFGKYYA
jgi:hypothetical protein